MRRAAAAMRGVEELRPTKLARLPLTHPHSDHTVDDCLRVHEQCYEPRWRTLRSELDWRRGLMKLRSC